ncbi:MAG TPA: hypothetical protein VLQ52_05640, partial [Coriobacteriia bacterium]|nr:hypothetical protein [Coriobacteriia bacterium]
ASALGAGAARALMMLTEPLATLPAGFLIQLAIAGLGGLVTAYGVMSLLRVPELADLVARVRERLGRRS